MNSNKKASTLLRLATIAAVLFSISDALEAQATSPEGADTSSATQPRPATPALAAPTGILDFYRRDWAGTLPVTQTPLRRALPPPLDSTPFPSSDWSYGASPLIGVPDTNVYPLMTALHRQNSL